MLVLGYLHLDRPGDFALATSRWSNEDDDLECVECGQPIRGLPWLAVTTTEAGEIQLFGPLCGACASSD
jgi:hypothetical protein